MNGFRNFGAHPPGGSWRNLGGNIFEHAGPLQIGGQIYPYGGMVIGHKPQRGPWNKPWEPTPPNKRQIDIAQKMAASRAQEQAKRQMEQAQARARAQQEAREHAAQERQRQEQLKRLREQLQSKKDQQQRQREEQLRRERDQQQRQRDLREQQLRRERDRIQQLRNRPGAMFEPVKPPPWYYTAYGSKACIANCDNPQLRRDYTSDIEAFERVFGSRLESAKKQELLKGILGTVYGNLFAYGIAKAPFMLKEMISSGSAPPTAIRGLTYQQELNRVGNEYNLLIDMVQRTGTGGAGVLEFPKEFQRLANILGKPVRAGFHANVKAGSTMEKLLNRIGHIAREPLQMDKNLSSAYTKVYYPKPK